MSYFITKVNNSLQLSKFDDQSENNNSITLYTPLPTKVSFTPGTPGILSVNNGQFYFQNIDKYLYTTVLTRNDIGPIIDGLRYGYVIPDAFSPPKLALVGIGSHTEYIMNYRLSSYNSSLNCVELILPNTILPFVNYLYNIHFLNGPFNSTNSAIVTIYDSNDTAIISMNQVIDCASYKTFLECFMIAKNAHHIRLFLEIMKKYLKNMYILGIQLC